jgi:hypothetical protein
MRPTPPIPPAVADRDATTSVGSPYPGLPSWESFPTQDRQILVTLLVQTVRRQAQTHPTNLPAERR